MTALGQQASRAEILRLSKSDEVLSNYMKQIIHIFVFLAHKKSYELYIRGGLLSYRCFRD